MPGPALRALGHAASLSVALATAAAGADVEFANPVLRQRADPHVVLHTDGFYYFMGTVPEYDRLELRRTRRLEDLARAEAKVIWRKRDAGPMGAHIWAPEIHHIRGKWYVYFAAGGAEKVWDIRMYVLENVARNPLEGQWVEKGQIRTQWESFSLDASTFEHRGTRYLVWAQAAPPEKGTNLYIARMDTPWSVVLPQVLISKPELEWETRGHRVNEGAAVIARNGRIFMTYSASATDAHYCMGLLTADESADLLDARSWRKSPTPVFATSDENRVYGPGHNSFTTTPDEKVDLLVYHGRAYRDIDGEPLRDPNRHTRIQRLGWKPDGTPDFGVPVPDGPGS